MGSIAPGIHIVRRNGEVLSDAAIKELKSSVKGDIVFKGGVEEDVYRAAIDRVNKAFIQEAGIIVFCESEADISACILYVQKWDLDVAIAGGRHSYYGASSTNGGLVIDLRKMRKVEIDVEGQSIAAQGGCLAVDLEAPLQELGYSVVMGAANDTGIGGLTLGGGSGALTGQYGLAIDNLLAARVVIADGSVLEASEKTNSDLFWGIRGGGSNFGVVTEFTFRIHKQGPVFFGPLAYTPDKIPAFLELFDTIHKTVIEAAGKLAVFAVFVKFPGAPKVSPLALVFYDGPEAEAKKHLTPLYDLEPIMNGAVMKKYADCTIPDFGPLDKQRYSTSNAPLETPFDIDVISTLVEDFDALHEKYGDAVSPSKIAIEIRSYAKTSFIHPSATALRARNPTNLCMIEAQYDSSISDTEVRGDIKRIMGKVRDKYKKKYPETSRFANTNISGGTEKVEDLFGENLERLRVVKRKYDPNSVWTKWYPIPPAEV